MDVPIGVIKAPGNLRTVQMHCTSSFLEAPWPVDLQHHSHLLICPFGPHGRAHGRNRCSSNFTNVETQKPMGRITSK